MWVEDLDCPPGGLPACLRHPQWPGHPWAYVSLTKVSSGSWSLGWAQCEGTKVCTWKFGKSLQVADILGRPGTLTTS